MSETPLAVSSAIQVWVIPPTPLNASGQALQTGDATVGYVFPWSWGWKRALQLIPLTSTDNANAMGSASFRLLRATRQEIGRKAYQLLDDQLVEGAWVCITRGQALTLDATGKPTDQVDPAAIEWCGWISTIERELLAGSSESVGSVQALGIGHLLDKRQVYGWAQAAEDPTSYAVAINSPPQANIAGTENHVIGNATLGTAPNGSSVYVFTRMPADCAPAQTVQNDPVIWTRWRLLSHLLAFCQPPMGAVISIATADDATPGTNPQNLAKIAGYLNDCTYPEVYELANLTWRGALDLLIPDVMGLGWTITVSKAGWTVTIFTVSDTNTVTDPFYFGVPKNPTTTSVSLPGEPTTAVTRRANAEDLPDEVVYESAEPCVFGFTVSFADGNLGKMWTAQQEVDYKAAASGASNYPATPTQQKEINAAVRAGPGFRDVFTKYGLNAFHGAKQRTILRGDEPVVSGKVTKALIPQLQWDGATGTLTIVNTTSRLPYLPTARFLRTLPWPEGLWADGTDHRDATSLATPQYLTPRVFRYDTASASNGGYTWVDLLARNGRPSQLSVQLDIDDRSPAVRIAANPPELLAYKRWTGSPTPAVSDVDPESDGRALDYTKLVLTAAMESDQRIQVIIPRPGTQAQTPTAPGGLNVRRSLIVRDDKLHCWVMLKNTILGIKNDRSPDYVTATNLNDASTGVGGGYALRNDWPLAQRRAKRLAAFVFRKRTAVTIERARSDDQPTWAVVGTLITKVIEVAADTTQGTAIPEVSTPCGTVIVEIVRTYGDRPRLRVTTGLPTMLSVGGGGSPSASAGGRVSAIGGGTVAQQVADVRQRLNVKDRDDVRVPVVVPKGGGSGPAQISLVIIGGNTLSDTFTAGIKWALSGVTTVPSLYDPTVDTTFVDGIGRAYLYVDDVLQGIVLVGNYSGNGGPITGPLVADSILFGAAVTVHIPLASDATKGVDVYVPASP